MPFAEIMNGPCFASECHPRRPAAQAFNGTQPETLAGTILLARSLVALGDNSRAQAVLSPFWRTEKLPPSEEAAIIKEFGSLIPTADHRFRMERMLYAERVASAQRVAELAGAKPLAEAWTAVIRGDKRARKLLDGVPEAQRSAGYLFAETRYLRRNEKFAEAAAIMLKTPTDKASLVDPDAWWIERRALARELADAKDIKNAYRIASQHAAESPANAVDAEFHAGWFALRAWTIRKRPPSIFPRSLRSRTAQYRVPALLLAWPDRGSQWRGRCRKLLCAGGT